MMGTQQPDRPGRASWSAGEVVVIAVTFIALGYATVTLVTSFSKSTLATPILTTLDPDDYSGIVPGDVELKELNGLADVEVGTGSRVLWWLVTGFRGLLLAGGLELIRRVISTRQDPFTEANVRRLRQIAGIAVVYQLVELCRGPVDVVISEQLGFGEIATNEQLGAPLVSAIFAAVLAQVWENGLRMRTEHDLTI